jgi:hypothetical protein
MPRAAVSGDGDCMGEKRPANTATEPARHDEELGKVQSIGGVARFERDHPGHCAIDLRHPDIAGSNLLGSDRERRSRERHESSVVAPDLFRAGAEVG